MNALTPAFILHRKAYSDSSLLIDFFTLEHGRLSAIAKGAKSSRSNKSAILQPFVPLMVNFSGTRELKTLRESDAVEHIINLQGKQLYAAYYVNELLIKFLNKHEPYQPLFALYAHLLKQLADPDKTQQKLRIFEMNLLEILGLAPQLTHDFNNAPLTGDQQYSYKIDEGPILLASSLQINRELPVCSGASLLALKNQVLNDPQHLREIKILMRYIIASHLNGYQFKSREFFSSKPVQEQNNDQSV